MTVTDNTAEWGVKFPSAETCTVFPFRNLAEDYLAEMVKSNAVWKPDPDSDWELPQLVTRPRAPWTVVEA